mmetsp:Transcript_101793/g.288264  ORF Transcript_101793/g.288264 Transcript_101793/m.288264 type:complete len:271 (+) Transcript_101793:116-928(+)
MEAHVPPAGVSHRWLSLGLPLPAHVVREGWEPPDGILCASWHHLVGGDLLPCPVVVQASVARYLQVLVALVLGRDLGARHAVLRAGALPVLHREEVVVPAHARVIDADDVLLPPPADHDNGVHLQVVADAGDGGLDDAAVGEPRHGHLAQAGVGLLGVGDVDLGADALPAPDALQPLRPPVELPAGNHLRPPLVEQPPPEVPRGEPPRDPPDASAGEARVRLDAGNPWHAARPWCQRWSRREHSAGRTTAREHWAFPHAHAIGRERARCT